MPLPPVTPSGASTAFLYATQPSLNHGGFSGIIGGLPPNVNPPIIFEPGCDFTGNQLKVVMIVTGTPPIWGGAQIWASVDGSTYGQIGTVYQGGRQGVLTAVFPSHVDPDTVDTLSVDITQSGGQIVSGSATDADFGITLAYLGAPTSFELIGYSNVTLTSPFKYDIDTYVRRGMYGSIISSHAIGAQFGLVDGNIFSQVYPQNYVGSTVFFKFLSFNSVGGNIQSLASVPAYPYTLTGIGVCPGGGPGTGCPVITVLAGGACCVELGVLGECIASSCDLGVLGTPVTQCIDLGVLGL